MSRYSLIQKVPVDLHIKRNIVSEAFSGPKFVMFVDNWEKLSGNAQDRVVILQIEKFKDVGDKFVG